MDMDKKANLEDNLSLAQEVAELLVEKKANRVLCLDISSLTYLTDCFIIADVEVQLQLDSLRSMLVDHLSAKGIYARNAVNTAQSGWALLDFNGFIVHLFLTDLRETYGLEKLWGEGKQIFP